MAINHMQGAHLAMFLFRYLSLREKATPAKTPALTATGIYGGKQNDTPAYSVVYIEKRVTPAWQGFFFQMWVKKYGFGQKYVFGAKNKFSKVFF